MGIIARPLILPQVTQVVHTIYPRKAKKYQTQQTQPKALKTHKGIRGGIEPKALEGAPTMEAKNSHAEPEAEGAGENKEGLGVDVRPARALYLTPRGHTTPHTRGNHQHQPRRLASASHGLACLPADRHQARQPQRLPNDSDQVKPNDNPTL